jgi:hypothetical protein
VQNSSWMYDEVTVRLILRVGSVETDCGFSQVGSVFMLQSPGSMAAGGKRGNEKVQRKCVMEYGPQEVEP